MPGYGHTRVLYLHHGSRNETLCTVKTGLFLRKKGEQEVIGEPRRGLKGGGAWRRSFDVADLPSAYKPATSQLSWPKPDVSLLECTPPGEGSCVCAEMIQRERYRLSPPLPLSHPASYPDVSLSMKMFAQRKVGRRQRVRRFACRRIPFSWSLAVHHQSLAFRARLCHEKNEAPEEAAVSHRFLPPMFAFFQQGDLFLSIVYLAKYYNHFVSLTSKNFNNLAHKFRKVYI